MKLKLRLSGLLFVTSLVTGFAALPLAASPQLSLLDPRLSQWETYLSYRHQEQYNGSQPTDAAGKPLAPLGLFPGLDPHGVFTLQQQGGETVLRVSGEIYGALTSKQRFRNYHLTLQYAGARKNGHLVCRNLKTAVFCITPTDPTGKSTSVPGCCRRNFKLCRAIPAIIGSKPIRRLISALFSPRAR